MAMLSSFNGDSGFNSAEQHLWNFWLHVSRQQLSLPIAATVFRQSLFGAAKRWCNRHTRSRRFDLLQVQQDFIREFGTVPFNEVRNRFVQRFGQVATAQKTPPVITSSYQIPAVADAHDHIPVATDVYNRLLSAEATILINQNNPAAAASSCNHAVAESSKQIHTKAGAIASMDKAVIDSSQVDGAGNVQVNSSCQKNNQKPDHLTLVEANQALQRYMSLLPQPQAKLQEQACAKTKLSQVELQKQAQQIQSLQLQVEELNFRHEMMKAKHKDDMKHWGKLFSDVVCHVDSQAKQVQSTKIWLHQEMQKRCDNLKNELEHLQAKYSSLLQSLDMMEHLQSSEFHAVKMQSDMPIQEIDTLSSKEMRQTKCSYEHCEQHPLYVVTELPMIKRHREIKKQGEAQVITFIGAATQTEKMENMQIMDSVHVKHILKTDEDALIHDSRILSLAEKDNEDIHFADTRGQAKDEKKIQNGQDENMIEPMNCNLLDILKSMLTTHYQQNNEMKDDDDIMQINERNVLCLQRVSTSQHIEHNPTPMQNAEAVIQTGKPLIKEMIVDMCSDRSVAILMIWIQLFAAQIIVQVFFVVVLVYDPGIDPKFMGVLNQLPMK